MTESRHHWVGFSVFWSWCLCWALRPAARGRSCSTQLTAGRGAAGAPQGVCAQHSRDCSLPSPAFLNVISSSGTAWQSEGQHSQLPACAWNPLLSFNHCLQAVPGRCRNPFSPRPRALGGNFLTFGLPREDGNEQLHHGRAGTGSCSSH